MCAKGLGHSWAITLMVGVFLLIRHGNTEVMLPVKGGKFLPDMSLLRILVIYTSGSLEKL